MVNVVPCAAKSLVDATAAPNATGSPRSAQTAESVAKANDGPTKLVLSRRSTLCQVVPLSVVLNIEVSPAAAACRFTVQNVFSSTAAMTPMVVL